MPEIIALDWERHRICGVQADIGKTVKIQKSFSAPVPEGLQQTPGDLGDWLRQTLQQNGLTARQVVVVVPREEVVMRHLELPTVSEDELPDLVRFQAAAKSTIPMDQLKLDFLPLPDQTGDGSQHVLVGTLSDDRIRPIRTSIMNAGLELTSIGVSSISAAVLVAQAEGDMSHDGSDISLVVARHADRFEISMLVYRTLLFSHSTPAQDEQAHTAVLSEVSRSLVALQKRVPNVHVGRCWLIGSKDEEFDLAQAIEGRFRCQVRRLDPFKTQGVSLSGEAPVEQRGLFAGPIGHLVGSTQERPHTIDFLHPRRPAEKVDHTRSRRIAAAAAAVLVVVGMMGYRMKVMADLNHDLKTVQKDVADKQSMLKAMDPQLAVTTSVEAWAGKRVDWLTEANALAATIDGTDRHYLTQLRVGDGTRNELGVISAAGHARERFDVEGLNARLMERSDFEVSARPIKRSGRDGEYPQQFEQDIRIKRPELEATPAASK